MWRKKLGIAIAVISLIGLIGLIWIKVTSDKNILGIVSPLAEELHKSDSRVIFEKEKKNYPPNENFPISQIPKFIDDVDITAKSYCVMDLANHELLSGRNLEQKLPLASVTKIMTAVVALERSSLNFEIQVSPAAATIGEAEMGLTQGEKLTTEELLYGMLLPSGNDAAETLAQGLARDRQEFISAMNQKARALDLYNTYFVNPTGLDGDSLNTTSYSTCLDLLSLTSYALKNPKFAEIVATRYKEIPYSEGKHKAFYLLNILQLNRSYPGIKGVKPGDTPLAHETLVSYAENKDTKLIVVLLGTKYSKDEVVKLYDYIYGKLGIKIK